MTSIAYKNIAQGLLSTSIQALAINTEPKTTAKITGIVLANSGGSSRVVTLNFVPKVTRPTFQIISAVTITNSTTGSFTVPATIAAGTVVKNLMTGETYTTGTVSGSYIVTYTKTSDAGGDNRHIISGPRVGDIISYGGGVTAIPDTSNQLLITVGANSTVVLNDVGVFGPGDRIYGTQSGASDVNVLITALFDNGFQG